MMKRKIRVKKFSLIELLVVISMIALLLTFIITFFNKGTKLCKKFSKKAYGNQQIMVLKNKWRKFIHNCDPGVLTTDKKRFISGEKSVVTTENHINFTVPEKTESYRLLKNMNVSFDIDYSTEIPLVIMNIKFPSSFPGEKDENIRIVACPGREK